MKEYVDKNQLNEIISSLEEQIETLKKSVSEGKALVATALTNKNVPTSTTATFQELADNITNNLRSADKYYRVQCGAYSSLANAQTLAQELTDAGYNCVIVYPTV